MLSSRRAIQRGSTSVGPRARGAALLVALVAAAMFAGPGPAGRLAAEAHATTTAWPATPPAPVCGDTALLTGPATPPPNAIAVPAGDNSGFDFNRPGAIFWFAPGTHTLGTGIYDQIIARDGTTYLGGPGAVVDGQHRNRYAFTNDVANVTIRYLTIQNFGAGLDNNNEGVVNHDAGPGWVIEYNGIVGNDGAGLFLGSNNIARYNCLKGNGQYGFSMARPPIEGQSAIQNLTLDHNEIVGNNTDDWESRIPGCGCAGAGKFWDVKGARITNNWIHDNRGPGLWADTNDIDFLIEGNYIDGNDGEGIWYEISYNATIRGNTIRHNAWVKGRQDQGSPAAGVYLSESGGEARLASAVSGAPVVRIYDNLFEDNFSGVSIYENANRFCNSNGNTSKAYCTPLVAPTLIPEPLDFNYPNPINATHPCYTRIAEEPYRTDCRWHARNIDVWANEFRFDPTVVPCAGNYCGVQALYASGADNIPWAPYTVAEVQADVMFHNGNRFHDNTYLGPWRFAQRYGETIDVATWRAAPFNQDAGSTFGGGGGTPPAPEPVANYLDADTATLEASVGKWQPWFSSSVARTTAAAHQGTASLRVKVTALYGWGVQLRNWPGFTHLRGSEARQLLGKARRRKRRERDAARHLLLR